MVPNRLDRRDNTPTVSRLRMQHVETRLRADAEAVLREIAYVLELTRRVKGEIVGADAEAETAGV